MFRLRSTTVLIMLALCFVSLFTFLQPVSADNYTVTNLNDSGSGSLRQAVISANGNPGNDTITFSVSGTITLTSGTIVISDNGSLTLEGDGITVSGNNSTRVFTASGATTVIMNNLTITGGSESIEAGGIYNSGNLTLNNVTVTGNNAGVGLGGGIYNQSVLTLNNSVVTGNTANGGGGIYSENGLVTLNNSTVSGNIATHPNTATNGAGILKNAGTFVLYNSIIANSTGSDCVGLTTAAYSVIEDGSCGISGTPTSPDANGNFTGDPNIHSTTLKPNAGSPVIDRGNPAAVGGGGSTCRASDKEGTSRPFDGDGDTVARCDIGAFEISTLVQTVSLLLNNTSIDEGTTATFTLTRNLAIASPLTVNLTLTPQNGLSASDYTLTDPSNNTITTSATIPANQASIDLTFTAINDGSSAEPAELLDVMMETGSGYERIAPNNRSVEIKANGLVVTNLNNSGEGSLRQAIHNANAFSSSDTITFTVSGTIPLVNGLPAIANNSTLTINGGGTITLQGGAGSFSIMSLGIDANVTLNGLSFTGGTTGLGGGVHLNTGTLTVNNSSFSGNSANGGGAIHNESGTLYVNNSHFMNNTALNGGSILSRYGQTTITNSTFTGNAMNYLGGGVFNLSSTVTIINSTFSGLRTSNSGSSIYNLGGSTYLYNSILANSEDGAECVNSAAMTIQYTLIEDGSCGISGTPASPDANGNFTGDPDINLTTLMPNTGSPVIDRGNPAAVGGGGSTCPATDKAGTARPLDGDGDTVVRCDMGAFETSTPLPGVSIALNNTNINEGSTVTFTLTRSYANASPLAVNVTLTGQNGLSAADYTLTDPFGNTITTSATIPANQTSIDLTFTALNDGGSAEAAEILDVTMEAGSGYSRILPYNRSVQINANGLVVTNLNNSGEGSLRQAITNANAFSSNDTITFTVSGTISLSSALPELANNGTLSINGGGVITLLPSVTNVRAFRLDIGANVSLDGLYFAQTNFTGNGGAIFIDTGSLTVTNSTFDDNGVSSGGGSIYNNAGTVNITGSLFINNTATLGGSIYNQSGQVTLTASTISRGSQGGATFGGGIYNAGGTVTVINSTITGITSGNHGAGIYNAGTLYVYNSTFSDNRPPNVSTIAADIYNSGTATVYNSILANQTRGLNCVGVTTIQYTLIEDGSCGISGTPSSPDANGNFTGDPNIDATTLMPNTGSPVIDRGNPAAVGGGGSTCLATDKAGTARPLDGDGDTVARCDMGAFEAPAAAPLNVTLSGGGTINEGSTTTFTVERSFASSNPLIVNLTLTPGTDLNDGDYDLTDPSSNVITTSVTIPANQSTVNLTFAALNDGSIAETAETFGISIAAGSYTIGSPNTAFATISANGMTVNTLNDSGEGSLRVAAANANVGGGTVDMTAINGTITLGSTIDISNSSTFDGPGEANLTVSASGFRAFSVTSGTVLFRSFTINGGGIAVSGGNVTIGNSPMIITGNTTNVCGGGLLVSGGSVTVQAGSEISNNTTTDNGGGVCVTAGSLTVIGGATRVTNNRATNGGGIYASGGSVTIHSSAVVNYNTATGNGGGIFVGAGVPLHVTGSFILINGAAAGDGIYSENAGIVEGTCIVGNGDTAIVNTSGTLTATTNWWGTSWGPNIPGAPTSSGSTVSSGDSIGGTGEASSSVNVGMVVDPSNYGTYSTAPTGNWMMSDPGSCGICADVSGVGSARACVGTRP